MTREGRFEKADKERNVVGDICVPDVKEITWRAECLGRMDGFQVSGVLIATEKWSLKRPY